MRILITGASGFVGPYLIRALAKTKHSLFLTSNQSYSLKIGNKRYTSIVSNLQSNSQISRLIKKTNPDTIIHLGAISHVVKADQDLSQLVNTNIIGTYNLCEATQQIKKPIRFLFISSALVYGPDFSHGKLHELSPTLPQTLYGKSKLAAENIVKAYESKKFSWVIMRPFNHTGPGQPKSFSTPGFAHRVAMARSGGEIKVGNLKIIRDFLDVRDVVNAYCRTIQKWPKNQTFVLSSGKGRTINSILQYFINLSGKKCKIKTHKPYFRRVDPPKIIGNPSKIQKALGWKPTYQFESTLRDIFEESRFRKK